MTQPSYIEEAAMEKDGELRYVDVKDMEEFLKLGWVQTGRSPPWGDWPIPDAPQLVWKDRYPKKR